MPFHVAIFEIGWGSDDPETKFNMSEDELLKRVVDPYSEGRPIVLNGKTIRLTLIKRIRITYTELAITGPIWSIDSGRDVTDELIVDAAGHRTATTRRRESSSPSSLTSPTVQQASDLRKVFVVHGRNTMARDAMFAFLRALGLEPLEWSEAVALTGKASPYIGEILDAAFRAAQAVVVLLTPDDEACLRKPLQMRGDPPFETQLTPQARPNVLFEAGMAIGRSPDRTVLVELGQIRPFSDTAGRHVIRLDDSPERRTELVQRLHTAGCPIKRSGTDWLRAGEFTGSLATFGDGARTVRATLVEVIRRRTAGLLPGVVPRVSQSDVVQSAVKQRVDYADALEAFDELLRDRILSPLGTLETDELLVDLKRLADE